MSLALRFLGTAAARPTIERNVSSIAVIREGETLLIDCGEGTQRQMLRYGISFALNDVFFTHFDTDHILGTVGLLRTFQLQGRTEPLRIWGPPGAERMIRRADTFGADKLGYPLEVTELTPETPVARNGYSIVPFAGAHHHTPVFGYAFIENPRLGRFNPEHARTLGIPEGPLWGALHRGQSVTLPDGRIVHPDALVGESRPGRRIAITGDTRPCESTAIAAKGADLLVHESTFADEEAARAVETGHSTAREAAEVAALAGVRSLILTHLSARYSRDTADLEREARSVFPQTTIARDGLEVVVPFPDEPLGDSTAEPPRPALQVDGDGALSPPRDAEAPRDSRR